MQERVFVQCLNKEPKIFNCNYGSLIGGAVMATIFGLSKGLLWGIMASFIGFLIGGNIGKQIFLGTLQSKLYWHLPFAKVWLHKNAPSSSNRYEL